MVPESYSKAESCSTKTPYQNGTPATEKGVAKGSVIHPFLNPVILSKQLLKLSEQAASAARVVSADKASKPQLSPASVHHIHPPT